LEKPRNCMAWDLDCMVDVLMGFHLTTFSKSNTEFKFRSHPIQFLGFSNHEKGTPRQEISKWSTVCSMFLRSGWSIVRSALLAKGGTSEKKPSLHLHKFWLRVIRWVHELCKQPSHTGHRRGVNGEKVIWLVGVLT
jgi:hypothetical protein